MPFFERASPSPFQALALLVTITGGIVGGVAGVLTHLISTGVVVGVLFSILVCLILEDAHSSLSQEV